MNSNREYVVVCRGCDEIKWVQASGVSACLTQTMCAACGEERQPFVRAVPGPSLMMRLVVQVRAWLHVPSHGSHARA